MSRFALITRGYMTHRPEHVERSLRETRSLLFKFHSKKELTEKDHRLVRDHLAQHRLNQIRDITYSISETHEDLKRKSRQLHHTGCHDLFLKEQCKQLIETLKTLRALDLNGDPMMEYPEY